MAGDHAGIVILGHPRSGTTLLRRLLDGHSRIACPPETHLLSACARFLETEQTAQGIDLGVLSGLNFAGIPDAAALAELRAFAFSFLQRYAADRGKPRWAEKTAFDAFYIEQIEQLCAGHTQFVCVVRHPLDVAISTREFCDSMGVYPKVLHSYIQAEPEPIRAFAHSWRDVAGRIDALCQRLPDSSTVVRYEDLVAAPEQELEKLLAFLGEAFEPAMLERALADAPEFGFGDHKSYSSTSVHGASLARWKTLPASQVTALAGPLNPMLARFGYPALEAGAAPDTAAARQRYVDNLGRLHRRAQSATDTGLPLAPAAAPESDHPFLVYDLGRGSRSGSAYTSQRVLAGGAGRVQVAAATVALLRRVSEFETLLLGVVSERDVAQDAPRVVPVSLPNTAGYRFEDILQQVEAALAGPAPATSAAGTPDVLVGPCDLLATTGGCPALGIGYADGEHGLAVAFSFDEGLWPQGTSARFTEHFLMLWQAMQADPGQLVDAVSLLTPEEEALLLPAEAPQPVETDRVDEKFFAQAALHPDKVAAVFEGQQLTYRELGQQVRALAAFIHARGQTGDTVIAVCLQRSLDLVTSLLAVMHAGATYVPLDPDHPASRIQQILDDAKPALVLTESSLADKFADFQRDQVIEVDREPWRECTASLPARFAAPELAYIIFTSGSTGRPKGVQVRHHGLSTFLDAMAVEPGLGADDRLLSVTTVSFDIAALELFLPLVVGATLYLASRRETLDGRALGELLAHNDISVFQATPATYQLLLTAGWQGGSGIKLLCGGEALPADLAAQLLDRCDQLWNMYGPTETTIWSTIKKVERPQSPMPIGSPIQGTRVYVLNEEQVPVPLGVPGELYIAGEGVAKGYHERPDLTAERFLEDPFFPDHDATVYRTGDLVRITGDGELFYLGRLDRQVKVRGFRIELGEIEVAIGERDDVQQCVVDAYKPPTGGKRLVAYIIPRDAASPVVVEELRNWLASRLPEYMVPAAVVNMESFPLTPNNKVDRKALPAPAAEHYGTPATAGKAAGEAAGSASRSAPLSELEARIIKSWEKYFGEGLVDREANFVSLGGDSLVYVQLLMELEDILGTVPEDWELLSIRELARREVATSPVFAEVDNTIVVRAVSIVAIVLLHLHPGFNLFGWTSGLFMVAGFLLAKFQFPVVASQGSTRPILLSAIGILIPSTILTLATQAYFGHLRADELLLYSNLLANGTAYWFIQVMIQFLLFAALLFSIGPVRRYVAAQPLAAGYVALAASVLLLLLAPVNGVAADKQFQLPYLRLWQFAVGWCIFFSATQVHRFALAYALVGVGILDYLLVSHAIGPDFAAISVGLGLVLIFVPKVAVIRPLHHVVYAVAGASLFIFLVHYPVTMLVRQAVLGGFGAPPPTIVYVLAGLLVGYLVWRLWEVVWRQVTRLTRDRGAHGWDSREEPL